MSRNVQDQFIDDDEEETCPLCVEEFDLTDKGFKPCQCGYQICQFCYHNVKTNMNGLCPACRRPYDDNNIEYKPITAEESAAHKLRQAQRQKKTQAALQKERQKAEADHLSRKHLAGLRVVQKNLVYVTGLSPTSQEDQLLQTLRGDQYFGQYGDIVKIVVSKAKDPSHPHSVGVYVTYRRKEDAESCIAAVDGSKNGDRTLRAQYGTTKYCSAYLRGENCQNRNCMFLHEPGEASDSYSRADLSALNAGGAHQSSTRPPPQSQQPLASASQPLIRQPSDQGNDPINERPALPSHASWASKQIPQLPSRTASRATSAAQESPAIAPAVPTPSTERVQEPPAAPVAQESAPSETPIPTAPKPAPSHAHDPFFNLLKNFNIENLRLSFAITSLSQADLDVINNYPPLFDGNGGLRRRARRQREEEQRRMEEEARAFQQPPAVESEDHPEISGSVQLGGEPEERDGAGQTQNSSLQPGHDPTGLLDQRFQFGGLQPAGVSDRGLTPQQHQQILLQTMKTANGQTPSSAPFQQQASNPPGHQRNASRYSFANDTSASTLVKPVASAKLLNQQSSIMPQAAANHFGGQHQSHGTQFYTSNVQGPPPGLKATGTPPISGGMTFGQGHGFATGGLQYGANVPGRNANEEMMRNLLRGRDTANVNTSSDATKHDAEFPSLNNRHSHPPSRQHSISLEEATSRRSTPPVPPGFEAQIANESRRSTPTVPPGLSRPTALPADLEGVIGSRPSSRASLRRIGSQILPALPLRPATPVKQFTTVPAATPPPDAKEQPEHETPTRPPRGPTDKAAKEALAESIQSAIPEQEQKLETAPSKLDESIDASAAVAKTAPPSKQKPSSGTSKKTLEAQESNRLKGKTVIGSTDLKDDQNQNQPQTPEAPKGSTRRNHPGKLDLAETVLKKDDDLGPLPSEEALKSGRGGPVTTAAKSLPPVDSVPSPTSKSAPRTIRVLPTPKAETPSASSTVPSTPAQTHATTTLSRQASIAAVNAPPTPTSEQLSIPDNISLASTSQSRANSPPSSGNKVGTAPVRPKTKSQLKKERQERAKIIEEEKTKVVQAEPAKAQDQAPAQEAIVSRKKKTRKEKEARAKPKSIPSNVIVKSTPTASRPPTPGGQGVSIAETSAKTAVESRETSTAPSRPPPAQPTPEPVFPSREPSPPPTPTLTAAQLIAEIRSSAPEIQKCVDSLFRSPAGNYFKNLPSITSKDMTNAGDWKNDMQLNLTKDEVDALLKGRVPAVHYGGTNHPSWDRGMVTHTGAHIRALTEELEQRFLDLERALGNIPDGLRFRPTKPQNDTGFPAVDLHTLKKQLDSVGGRAVSVMEQMIQDGGAMKKGAFLVDEATKYLNEFVMPPPPPPPMVETMAATGAASHHQGAGDMAGAASGSHGLWGPGSSPSSIIAASADIAERALQESRRVSEERDLTLRKAIKKNKKLLGL